VVTFGLAERSVSDEHCPPPHGCAHGAVHGFHGALEMGHGRAEAQMASALAAGTMIGAFA